MTALVETESHDLATASKAEQREWQLPLVFFSIVLMVWAAMWFGLSVLA